MNLLPHVDLRSSINEVYNQSSTNACGPHAVVNALDAMFDNAGQSQRFSRAWVWWWVRVYQGMPGANIGSTFESLRSALEWNGAKLESEWPWDNQGRQPTDQRGSTMGIRYGAPYIDGIDAIKRLLCHGLPVIYRFQVNQSFYDLRDRKDWRTHSLNPDLPLIGDHYVCIQGYDDAAGRFLIENSFGPEWGDGGFFGIPYDQILHPGIMSGQVNIIDHIEGFKVKPVEGFVTVPTYLNAVEMLEFTSRNREPLKAELMAAFGIGGVPALVDACKKWGVSDKHLELLAGWERGAVKAFKDVHPDVNWDNFVFDLT